MNAAVLLARRRSYPRTGAIPSLALRSAYTIKGLALGIGAVAGAVLGGPWWALPGTWVGWMVGNGIAARAEGKEV